VDPSKYGLTFVPGGPYNLSSGPPQPITAYFDSDGFTATPQNGYYSVVLNFQQPSPVLSVVTATVSWPWKSASPNTTVFVTQIANYQQ
jgi:hypothetical protein